MLSRDKILVVIITVEIIMIGILTLKIISNFGLNKTAKIVYTKEIKDGNYEFFGVCDVTRRLSKDKDLYVELIPDVHIVCPRGNKAIYIDINSEGFRDKEFSPNKSTNTVRILAMGDSYTYGWYVNLNETWPKKLENLLNEKSNGTKYEVLNLGIPGYDIWNVANLFVKKTYKYDPDIILISFIDNDVSPEQKICFNECINISSNKTQCKVVCHTEIMYEFIRNDTHIFEYVNKSFSLIRSKYGGEIYLIMFPLGRDSYERIVENLAIKYDIKVCKMHEIYKNWPLEDLILDKERDHHPNEFAYSLIAEEIYKCLPINLTS
jgi:lysophospholipase L1-like esterase